MKFERVRVGEANRLRHDRGARFAVKRRRWLLYTSLLKGINNKIDVIKRMA